jgi:hypothetical protein
MSMEQPETPDSNTEIPAEDDMQAGASTTEDNDLEQDSQEQTEQQEEEEEVDVDGRKFALPKSAAEKLNAERMMHADYTRKTQEAAEMRRRNEAEAEQLANDRKSHGEYLKDVARVVAIDEQLAEFAKLDWNSIIEQDAVTAQKLQIQLQTLQHQRGEAVNAITQKQQQYALNEQQSFAKRVQDAEAYLTREIQGWSQRSNQLVKYASTDGVEPEALAKALVQIPALGKYLHKAELYDQLVKKQKPPPPNPVSQAQPVRKVGSKSSVQKDPSQMTDKEFAAWRQSQIRNRNK